MCFIDIEEGIYRFTVTGQLYEEKAGLHAEGEFLIGSPPIFFDTHCWSNTNYEIDDPSDQSYFLGIRSHLYVENYDDVEYVNAIFPGGEVYPMEQEWDVYSENLKHFSTLQKT